MPPQESRHPSPIGHHTRSCAERGAVTAEVAITLPVLLTVLILGIWLIGTSGSTSNAPTPPET